MTQGRTCDACGLHLEAGEACGICAGFARVRKSAKLKRERVAARRQERVERKAWASGVDAAVPKEAD